ncbi:hypothetical protein ACWD0J_37340 [Streptomyces sp. NPDC003011]
MPLLHAGSARQPRPSAGTKPHSAGGWLWLVPVAAAFLLAQLALVGPGTGLTWDEIVHVSQVDPRRPAAFFSPARARGVTFLAAPVVAVTSSTVVLRVWLALLSGCGLLLALATWRLMVPPPVLATAGALWCALWVTLLYGSQATPNLWVALAALTATGWALRAALDPGDKRAVLGLTTAVAFVALMRPMDALWLVLPLEALVLHRAWRAQPDAAKWQRVLAPTRPWRHVLAAPVAGLAVGCLPWIAEAYARYGGLRTRLRRASEIQGSLGWHWAVDDHLRALSGRVLCRPCDVPWPHPSVMAWWLALPILVIGGLYAARRAGRSAGSMTAAATGVCLAAPYLFTVDYAAPRFLLPAYALLSLPVAELLAWTATRGAPVRTVLCLCLVGHLITQYHVLDTVTGQSNAVHATELRMAAVLRRAGVRPPCVISGQRAIPLAQLTGCASRQVDSDEASSTWQDLRDTASFQPVAVLVAVEQPPPPKIRDWQVVQLPSYDVRPQHGAQHLRAHISGTDHHAAPRRPNAVQ